MTTTLERFVGSYPAGEAIFTKPFLTKGLAFAFGRREAPRCPGGEVRVEKQSLAPGGLEWAVVESWTFYADGRSVRN